MKQRRDIVLVEHGSGVDAIEEDLIRQEPIIPVIYGNMTHAVTLRLLGRRTGPVTVGFARRGDDLTGRLLSARGRDKAAPTRKS